MNAWLKAAMIMGAAAATCAALGDVPPLGQRVYVLDNKTGTNAITSGKGAPPKGVVMKDPIVDSKKISILPKAFVLQPKVLSPAEKAAVLSFRQKTILGRYAKPRVAFNLKALPLKRANEELKIDAIGNIFKSDAVLEGHTR